MVLSRPELNLLRFTCDLYAGEESPLASKSPISETGNLQAVAQGLLDRKLVQEKSFRPTRELLRRLLIASQPDARVVLMRSEQHVHEALFEVYERAHVYMPYRCSKQEHELDSPIEEKEVFNKIKNFFSPRGSTGDLIRIDMNLAEYFVFSVLAGDLQKKQARKKRRVIANSPTNDERAISHTRGRGPSVIVSNTVDEEGTPIRGMLRDLPPELGSQASIPSPKHWEAALDRLIADDIVVEKNNRHSLRPYLHDLAEGLSSQRRYVLTRFDFVMEDWIVRDASFITVPGSIFKLQAEAGGRVQIRELLQKDFGDEVWRVIKDPQP